MTPRSSTITLSPLATQNLATAKSLHLRGEPVFGFAVHQTGSSEAERAVAAGKNPLSALVDYYRRPDSYSGAYVIGYGGEIIQVVDEIYKANHIGFEDPERDDYLDGDWKKRLPKVAVTAWMAQWGKAYKSPAHLFPGRSPNRVYVGVELLPIVKGVSFKPMAKGLLFTKEQHDAVIRLAADVAHRWGFPDKWWETGRLVGHEDVNPCNRVTSKGCWDPGFLRPEPWFDFNYVRAQIAYLTAAVS